MNAPQFVSRLVVAGLAIAALSAGPAAQSRGKAAQGPTPIRVDGSIIKGYIEYMSSDDKEGRRSFTPGYEKVAEWAAGKFKEWGLEPGGENGTFFQAVPVTGPRSAFAWTTGVPALTVDGRAFYVKDGDFTLDTRSTPAARASGEIVFAGYGISAPAKGLDEYAGVDVKGKIVLVLKGSPKDAPAARGMFGVTVAEPKDVEPWTAEARDQAKIATAYEKGAAAIILFAPERLSQAAMPGVVSVNVAAVITMPAGGGPQPGASSSFSRPFLVVSDVNERVFRQVMYRDPQESPRGFASRIERWRRDIRDRTPRSAATGVQAQITGYQTTTFYGEAFKNNVTRNVIAKVSGTDPKLKSEVVVIGGHLDHLGVTNGVVFNGADDDASGAATAMEMARLLAANKAAIKPKRTIYVALWAAEEMGLVGSTYWVKHPTDGVSIDKVVANFNNDMVGLGDRIGAPGALNFPAIWDVIMRNQEPDVVRDIETSTAGPGGSDYAPFIEQGIEALALMTSGGVGHPDYHDAGDDTAKIDAEMLRRNAQFVLQGTINVANETAVSLLVPDRLHLYNGMRLSPLNLDEVRAGGVMMMGPQGPLVPPGPQAPRFGVSLSDVSAFGGNLAFIDLMAKVMGVGRVAVGRPDGAWFTATGVTERGKAALRAFEAAGVVLQFHNPPARLLEDLLDNAKKGFIVTGLAGLPDAASARRIVERNVLVAVDFDLASPEETSGRLIELKKALGGSGNLLLTTPDRPAASSPMGEARMTPRQQRLDQAKQRAYLALIKAGWTKDEIYAMAGVNPPQAGPMQMPPPGAGRLGGNLGKLAGEATAPGGGAD